jgi:hypothetical protein
MKEVVDPTKEIFAVTHWHANPTASSQLGADIIDSSRGNNEFVVTMQLDEDPKDSVIQEDISDAFNIAHCLSAILVHLFCCLMADRLPRIGAEEANFRIRFVTIGVLCDRDG